jgi:tetratricopeptide (TPR) repeat protein
VTTRPSVAAWLLGATAGVGALLGVRPSQAGRIRRRAALGAAALLSLGTATWVSVWLAVGTWGAEPATGPVVYITAMLATLGLLAMALGRAPGEAPAPSGRPAWAPALVVAAIVLVGVAEIHTLQAAIHALRASLSLSAAPAASGPLAPFERAVALQPSQDAYQSLLATALAWRARETGHPSVTASGLTSSADAQTWLERARHAAGRARELRPLVPEYTLQLGRVEQLAGMLAATEAGRQAALGRALRLVEDASRLYPNAAVVYDEWGRVYELLGRPDEARVKFADARRLEPASGPGTRAAAGAGDRAEDPLRSPDAESSGPPCSGARP